jgi:AraC family transcriptional regulator of adaptative response/methylated-DNA-[protein]-cysteine methyltransferase
VTPGEFKSRGAGIRIEYGFHPTRFGPCLLGLTRRGICWLSFVSDTGKRAALQELKSHWGGATFAEQPDATGPVAGRIFPGLARRQKSPLSLLLMGTNFQIKVWRALLEIPAGAVASYEAIGARIGAAKAARAIGSAVGPRDPQVRRARRLSLGRRAQAGDAGLGSGPRTARGGSRIIEDPAATTPSQRRST